MDGTRRLHLDIRLCKCYCVIEQWHRHAIQQEALRGVKRADRRGIACLSVGHSEGIIPFPLQIYPNLPARLETLAWTGFMRSANKQDVQPDCVPALDTGLFATKKTGHPR